MVAHDTAAPGFFDCPALTPNAFLERATSVYGHRLAVVDGDRRYTYAEFADRCARLAGALSEAGVQPGETVSVLAPNTELALSATFGVPWAGAVLNPLNTRLAVDEIAYIVEHAGATALLVDGELAGTAKAVAAKTGRGLHIVVDDGDERAYEAMLDDAAPLRRPVSDEMSLPSLIYTSGTTGQPKGVMYAHRGAYLQALAMVAQTRLDSGSVFLWTLPLFHCNGWCFPWAVTAVGAVHVMLRRPDPAAIWDAVRNEGVTHFNAARTVLASLSDVDEVPDLDGRRIQVATRGAPPTPAVLHRLSGLGIEVTHLYGLTETYGPAVICERRPEWGDCDETTRAALVARQCGQRRQRAAPRRGRRRD